MKSNYKRLAPYIRQIDERNSEDVHYDLLGVSVEKCFIKSIANTVGTDWRGYKKIRRKQFCYIPDTSRRGDKIGIALQSDYDIALVSQAYTVFEIIDTNELLPEYLNLWFKRPEFDRYARFHSHGSVREIFDWDEMCNVELPIPPLAEQQKIVDTYNIIERRIELKRKTNANLEEQCNALYKNLTVDLLPNYRLSDIATITMGQSPAGNSYNLNGNGHVFYQGRADFTYRFPICRVYTTSPTRFAQKGDILMSVRAPVGDINIAKEYCCIGRGLAALRSKKSVQSFLYYTLANIKQQFDSFEDGGTVFGSINKGELFSLPIVVPEDGQVCEFERVASVIDNQIAQNEFEMFSLKQMQSLILAQLSH